VRPCGAGFSPPNCDLKVDRSTGKSYDVFGFGEGWQLSEADLTSRGACESLSLDLPGYDGYPQAVASTLDPDPLREPPKGGSQHLVVGCWLLVRGGVSREACCALAMRDEEKGGRRPPFSGPWDVAAFPGRDASPRTSNQQPGTSHAARTRRVATSTPASSPAPRSAPRFAAPRAATSRSRWPAGLFPSPPSCRPCR